MERRCPRLPAVRSHPRPRARRSRRGGRRSSHGRFSGMVARAIWVDLPRDKAERMARFDQWKKRDIEDELRELRGLAAVGVALQVDLARLETQVEELAGVDAMPNDFDLLGLLRLRPYYEVCTHRPASSHLHYGLHLALDELIAVANAGGTLPARAADARARG